MKIHSENQKNIYSNLQNFENDLYQWRFFCFEILILVESPKTHKRSLNSSQTFHFNYQGKPQPCQCQHSVFNLLSRAIQFYSQLPKI
jgi:hypothetical protein